MAKIGHAVWELGVRDFVLRGQPTNETEFNEMFTKVTGKTDDDMAIESSNPADFGCTWAEVKAKFDELVAAEPLKELRQQRNQMLTECDWTRMDDNGLTDEQKTEWATYRQALRDITDTYTSLDVVVWPTKPE